MLFDRRWRAICDVLCLGVATVDLWSTTAWGDSWARANRLSDRGASTEAFVTHTCINVHAHMYGRVNLGWLADSSFLVSSWGISTPAAIPWMLGQNDVCRLSRCYIYVLHIWSGSSLLVLECQAYMLSYNDMICVFLRVSVRCREKYPISNARVIMRY